MLNSGLEPVPTAFYAWSPSPPGPVHTSPPGPGPKGPGTLARAWTWAPEDEGRLFVVFVGRRCEKGSFIIHHHFITLFWQHDRLETVPGGCQIDPLVRARACPEADAERDR